MFAAVKGQIRPALVSLALFSALLGLGYPVVITGIAHGLFSRQAHGSLVLRGGRPAGSELIGQPFTDPKYFWGRPSATTPFPYNAQASSGSNLGPTNPALKETVRARIEALRAADPGNTSPVPVDLVTASASGLDPHISPAAAEFQVRRVARARRADEAAVRALVARFIEDRQAGVLGEPRVNVLELNLVMDTEVESE
jgi:K+-transporting ATPase ATPase C chain